MFKKHVFLQFFAKIAIFACVFCTIPAWSETTCDIDYTPVTGNSIQNGTPTPENPVEVISVGDRTKNLAKGSFYTISATSSKAHAPIELQGDTWITDGKQRGVAKIIEVEEGKTYTVSMKDKSVLGSAIYSQYASLEDMGNHNNCLSTSSTIVSGAKYALIGFWGYPTPEAGQTVVMEEFQIEEGSVVTSYIPYGYQIPVVGTGANGSQATTSVYLDEPLRKVGDYADVLDYKNGTITRNVGVLVLDGVTNGKKVTAVSEAVLSNKHYYGFYGVLSSSAFYAFIGFKSSHFSTSAASSWPSAKANEIVTQGTQAQPHIFFTIDENDTERNTINGFNAWLAQQYAAGTPVTVYYPLATPVVEQIENWSCTPPITDIKIATTKYVDDEFAPLNTALANAISVVDNVVTQTIAQAGQIATLQNTKQTRPDDDDECPAGKKCLLVTDESGTPHWYEIVEP